jgi:hypothetical protein
MASTFTFGAGIRRKSPDCRPVPMCDPRPVCPACGGLECLCRPRFFAGQLLSEEDLNRLNHYIVAKNQLHNRHLFGTGVACGLEVVCSSCDPAGTGDVVVKSGYALSPCGNDIVVCSDTTVNVCNLINRCVPRNDDCFKPATAAAPASYANDQSEEDWVLAICYQEKPSRGITALRGASCGCGTGASSTGSGCGCGSKTSGSSGRTSGGCGCGCGGGGTSTRTAMTKSAVKAGGVLAPQCEPTLVCEGYSFAVYKDPQSKVAAAAVDPGALIRRFTCCFQPLVEQLTAVPDGSATAQDLQSWLQGHVAAVRDFLITEGLYDCDLAAQLGGVALPASTAAARGAYLSQWNIAAISLMQIIAAVFRKCLCAALLPPCPPAEMNDCVPIATLTVARGSCRVKRICNVGSRKYLITWPAVQYWLSWLPMFSSWQNTSLSNGIISKLSSAASPTLRNLLETICCRPIVQQQAPTDATAVPVEVLQPSVSATAADGGDAPAVKLESARSPLSAGAAGSLHPFTQLLSESLAGAPTATAATLLMAAMGVRAADGSALASDVALQYPGEAMLIHQVLGPMLAPLAAAMGAGGASASESAGVMSALKDLRATVAQQQADIERLKGNR